MVAKKCESYSKACRVGLLNFYFIHHLFVRLIPKFFGTKVKRIGICKPNELIL